MAQQKGFSNPFSGNPVSKFFESYQKMPFNLQVLLDTQRKNFQTLSEAQQMAFENFQAIAYRQAEIFSQALESHSTLTSELMKEGKPEDKLAKNAEAIKSSYEKAMTSAAEISDMVKKANADAVGLLNKRVSASLREVKSALADTDSKSEKNAA